VENTLGLEIVVVEQAASPLGWMGKEKNIADQVEAMRERMNKIYMRGRIVIGEGERMKPHALYREGRHLHP